MTKLRSAGVVGKLFSALFPKQMTAHVRTETLPNGQVEVVPVFMIDGREVPPEMVGDGSSQTILGFNVILDSASQCVQKQTQGKVKRLSKKMAAEFLRGLQNSNVSVRSKDGRHQPQIMEAKPNVELSLQEGDILKVVSELVMPNGVIVDKPASLDQLRQDEGWMSVGDDLVKVVSTETPHDEVLIAEGSPATLVGDARASVH